LSQQPRIGGKYQYIIDAAPADLPIHPTDRGYLLARRLYIVCGTWSHVGKYAALSRLEKALLEIQRKTPSPVPDLLDPEVLNRQAARDGRPRGGLLSLLLLYCVSFHSQKVYPGLDELKDGHA
ncbi:hypothetical protein T03_2624, partial [Trichinella britovi]